MLRITHDIEIDETEIHFDFIRASGPGGQKVNKTSSAVQLRFDVNRSSLPEAVRNRLKQQAGRRMSEHGVLIIEAKRFRTQARNRQDALDRLVGLIQNATRAPKARRKSKPSPTAKKQRLEAKLRRGKTKRLRQPVAPAED